MPKIDIKVKNKGLLEVPEGKKVNELPLKHFEDLVEKKGYDKIIKALNNLQVWNRNDDKELSKWAEDTMEKLKKKFRPEEVEGSAKEDWKKSIYGQKWDLQRYGYTAIIDARKLDGYSVSIFNPEGKKIDYFTTITKEEAMKEAEDILGGLKDAIEAHGLNVKKSTKNKHYIVHESIGNYSDKVFESDDFYEVQDYLEDRWVKYAEEERVGLDDEKERELFDSYFYIEEKEIKDSAKEKLKNSSKGFHVGDKVHIKDRGDNQVYEITDISSDEVGDKFFNLYSFKLDDVIEEPFYDYELEHASIKCSKVAQALNKLSAKENYYFSDVIEEGEIKVYPEKELIRVYQDVIKEHNSEIPEEKGYKFDIPQTIKDVEKLAKELGHVFKPSKLNELSSKLKAKIETSATEALNKTPEKSKVRKALDAIFPACDLEMRFPEKTVFKDEVIKDNLDKNKKHEYLAQSSKVAKVLKRVNIAKTTKEVSENIWQVLKPLGFEMLNKRTFTKDFDEGFVDDFGSVYTRCLIETRDNGETFRVTKYERNPKYANGKAEVIKIVNSLSEAVDTYKEFMKDKAIGSKVAKALKKVKK